MSAIQQLYIGGGYGTKPGAPTITSAIVVGLNSVSVAFTAGISGSFTTTSYIATSSPGGFTGTITQSGSGSIVVSGLTAATVYAFTVKAVNIVGQSNASNSVSTYTPYGTTGTTTWNCPATGTYNLYAVGGGGSGNAWNGSGFYGAGGGSGYLATSSNTITVGTVLTLNVGGAGAASSITGYITANAGITGGSGGNGVGGNGGSGGGCAPADGSFVAGDGGYSGSNGQTGAATGGTGQSGVAYGSGVNTKIPPGGCGSYIGSTRTYAGIYGFGSGKQASSNETPTSLGSGGGGATWAQPARGGTAGFIVITGT